MRGAPLTRREAKACKYLAAGYRATQAAAHMGVEASTVGVLLARARVKLGATTNAQLAVLFDRAQRKA